MKHTWIDTIEETIRNIPWRIRMWRARRRENRERPVDEAQCAGDTMFDIDPES